MSPTLDADNGWGGFANIDAFRKMMHSIGTNKKRPFCKEKDQHGNNYIFAGLDCKAVHLFS